LSIDWWIGGFSWWIASALHFTAKNGFSENESEPQKKKRTHCNEFAPYM